MVSEGNGWYTYTIPMANCSNIIFSNNGASQTPDLNRCGEGWYDAGTWYSSDPSLNTGLKVHLKTTWTNPKMYFWNATPGGATTSWPGVSMVSEGNGWYTYTIPNASCSNIIFSNNGASKTADLYRCGEGWYSGATWYNSQATVVSSLSDILLREEQLNANLNLSHYPNPAKEMFVVNFTLTYSTFVTIDLYNTHGERVLPASRERFSQGTHDVKVSTGALQPGLYIYTLTAGNIQRKEKVMIVK
jgi:alpha-amylase